MVQSQTTGQRDDLSGEHALGDLGQILFACLFFAVWVLDSFVFGQDSRHSGEGYLNRAPSG